MVVEIEIGQDGPLEASCAKLRERLRHSAAANPQQILNNTQQETQAGKAKLVMLGCKAETEARSRLKLPAAMDAVAHFRVPSLLQARFQHGPRQSGVDSR